MSSRVSLTLAGALSLLRADETSKLREAALAGDNVEDAMVRPTAATKEAVIEFKNTFFILINTSKLASEETCCTECSLQLGYAA
jgi:hypothetical protein